MKLKKRLLKLTWKTVSQLLKKANHKSVATKANHKSVAKKAIINQLLKKLS